MRVEACQSLLESWGVKVRRISGNELLCLCPLHDDHRISFAANAEKEVWVCYTGCGGGHLSELAFRLKKSFDPNQFSAPRRNWEFATLDIDSNIVDLSGFVPLGDVQSGRDFIESRGIPVVVSEALGWLWSVDDGAAIYPVLSPSGEVCGYLSQRPGGKAISPGFSNKSWLYGFYETRTIPTPLVLVEGVMDAAKVYLSGYRTSAIMGSTVSSNQLRILSREPVIVFPDNDEAGYRWAGRYIKDLYTTCSELRCVVWPSSYAAGADPGSIDVSDIQRLLAAAIAADMELDIDL